MKEKGFLCARCLCVWLEMRIIRHAQGRSQKLRQENAASNEMVMADEDDLKGHTSPSSYAIFCFSNSVFSLTHSLFDPLSMHASR